MTFLRSGIELCPYNTTILMFNYVILEVLRGVSGYLISS